MSLCRWEASLLSICCPLARQQPWFIQITVLLFMSSYLLHIFMEAGCLDWCVVIGLILRESSVVSQILGIAQSSEIDGEMLQNIKAGLHAVDRWASTDCPGYKPFLNIIKPQLQKLSEITEELVQPDTFQPITVGKSPEQTSPRAEESRGSSSHGSITQSETGSNNSMVSRKEEDTTQADEEEPFQDGAYDCSVS